MLIRAFEEVEIAEISGEVSRSPVEYAQRIRAAWQNSVAAIFEVGRLLTHAKAGLAHGEFEAMVTSALPFGPSTARRLMAIAADERLTNRAHVHVLPPYWGTLYELTKLDDTGFEAAIAKGIVHPEMDRKDIARVVKRDRRAERERELGERQTALPQKKYGVIYADCEWKFLTRSEDGMDRSAENHYTTSPLLEIQCRDVASIAAPDCVCFFWATVPHLVEAFCVLDAWGFMRLDRDAATGFLSIDRSAARYVSSAVWTKYWPGQGIGIGYWFRVDHEILLVATRGHIMHALPEGEQWRSIFDVPASRVHSEKPELVHELIEAYFPSLPKIELNARRARPGWDAWGNEAPREDAA
jgi:N6-adenosine-specific RNA methylase IME4